MSWVMRLAHKVMIHHHTHLLISCLHTQAHWLKNSRCACIFLFYIAWNDVLKIIILNIKPHFSKANFHKNPQVLYWELLIQQCCEFEEVAPLPNICSECTRTASLTLAHGTGANANGRGGACALNVTHSPLLKNVSKLLSSTRLVFRPTVTVTEFYSS